MDYNYRCVRCECYTKTFPEIIDHNIIFHGIDVLKIKKIIRNKNQQFVLQSKNYKVIPNELQQRNFYIQCNLEKETLQISRLQNELDSPFLKKARFSSTPAKKCLFTSMETEDKEGPTPEINPLEIDDEEIENENDLSAGFLNLSITDETTDTSKSEIDLMIDLLPKVIDNLKTAGHFDMYFNFSRLLAENKFPLSNIAYLLFVDIVNWFSAESTSKMRYSDDVKQFWRTGFKLFKGKFLRFMGGPKSTGQPTESITRGSYDPQKARINFVVPDRKILENVESPVSTLGPEIMINMINTVAEFDPMQEQTYKVCVDGKKINAGVQGQKLGDVNLWGFEDPPSLSDRTVRYTNELSKVKTLQTSIERFEIIDTDIANELSDDRREFLANEMKEITLILTNRVKDLRNLKVGRKLTLDKLMNQVTGDWRNSKLSFAISAVRSSIYEIDACIVDILHTINSLGVGIANCNDSTQLFNPTNEVNLSYQSNFVCLSGIEKPEKLEGELSNTMFQLVKQRSDAWFALRKLASVTGSTYHRALGFDGLKKQQSHYDAFILNKPVDAPDQETQKKMQHGSDNEINAIATLVSKVLPVYFPNLVFIEEGCYMLPQKEEKLFIVSPDGSLRKQSPDILHNAVQMGIEIKCPYPGNVYKTPVQYTLPVYYALQILSEMFAMNVQKLLFVSYSEESTAVSVAEFDGELWERVWKVYEDLYCGDKVKYPKSLHPCVKQLRTDLSNYVKDKVRLLCEVQSAKAISCEHSGGSWIAPHLNFHSARLSIGAPHMTLSDISRILYKCKECIHLSWQLCRLRASEVLMFLIADLDRMHKSEQQYFAPIAYAFKGYSMKTNVMRLMLDRVLDECYQRGLYTPVISFDGQWYNIAVRDREQRPLTLLQLQKDTFAEAKKETKSAIIHKLVTASVVQESTLDGLISKVDINFSTDDNGFFNRPIYVGNVLEGKMFRPSINIANVVRIEMSKKKESKGKVSSENTDQVDDTDNEMQLSDYILSCLPDDVLATLDKKTFDDIQGLEAIIQTGRQENVCKVSTGHGVENLSQLPECLRAAENRCISEDSNLPETSVADINIPTSSAICEAMDTNFELDDSDFNLMICALKESKDTLRWEACDVIHFKCKFDSKAVMKSAFLKREMQTCLRAISPQLKEKQIVHALSWPKYKIIDFFDDVLHGRNLIRNTLPLRRHSVKSLKKISHAAVSSIPKEALNAAYAEYIFSDRLRDWRKRNPFNDNISFGQSTPLCWYSQPEHIPSRYTYQFSLLDTHHLLTNARVKVCNTGIMESGLNRNAWVRVAKDGKADLNIALVEDLVDKQSNAFAQATFSEKVENAMIANGDVNEAAFCKAIREWYDAEDTPGIPAVERCHYRLNMREWLLQNVRFNRFPPPGMHVKGIPVIMFEGLLTNIDRRLQLFSFVKKGIYNVRALGSLEAENMFGEFQDLDPRGSGIIRPDDIPSAISTACELLSTRMDKQKKFYMHTSRAKLYPLHQLMDCSETRSGLLFVNPINVNKLVPKNHMFDVSERAERKYIKRKASSINTYREPAKGARPVRQHHHCDEEKILAHKRLGIDFQE